MRIRTSLAVCLIYGFSSFSQATDPIAELVQKLEGTLYVIPHRETADGVLTGCGLEFAALKRDFSTKRGAPVKIAGSFYLRPNPNTGLAYVLKLGVFDGLSFENGFAPNNAFISAPNGKTPAKAIKTQAENPGFALFIGGLDSDVTAAYAAITEKSQLVVGFNRKPGQQDVTFILDLAVIDTQMQNDEVVRKRSNEPVHSFVACSTDLLNSSKRLIQWRKRHTSTCRIGCD